MTMAASCSADAIARLVGRRDHAQPGGHRAGRPARRQQGHLDLGFLTGAQRSGGTDLAGADHCLNRVGRIGGGAFDESRSVHGQRQLADTASADCYDRYGKVT